jgi:hypothetical protein
VVEGTEGGGKAYRRVAPGLKLGERKSCVDQELSGPTPARAFEPPASGTLLEVDSGSASGRKSIRNLCQGRPGITPLPSDQVP